MTRLSTVALLALAACGTRTAPLIDMPDASVAAATGDLVVVLRTDAMPGVDFNFVDVTVGDPSGASHHQTGTPPPDSDLAAGVIIAHFEDLPAGTQAVALELRAEPGGDFIASRTVMVTVPAGEAAIVTVVITRSSTR